MTINPTIKKSEIREHLQQFIEKKHLIWPWLLEPDGGVAILTPEWVLHPVVGRE
jgi:hypothetical protein